MQHWDTRQRTRSEQYSYWREVVCEAFTPLRPAERGRLDSWQREGLHGWVTSHPFGEVNGAEIAACDQTIHHGEQEVRRAIKEVAFVNLMIEGRCVVRQGSAEMISPAGTFTIVDAREPFTLDYLDNWRSISFRVPTDHFARGLPQSGRARAHASTSGMGAVIADTMRTLWSVADTLDQTQAAAAGMALASLIDPLVHGESAVGIPEKSANASTVRDAIERHLSRHLPYVDASPSAIARRFAMSVRGLHKLYESAPATYGQTVMRIRVEQCAAELVTHQETVTALAAKWGFSDLSHLNRVFLRHVGLRPTEYVRGATRPHAN